MCTIIGILGDLKEKNDFLNARDAMKYRGPDDKGDYYNRNEKIALGHRRLSIIDLSKEGHQPMESNDGRYVIVFNGEIYNYIQLKNQLKDFYNFKTKTDTEVLLAAYMKWGVKCLDKLNGMFSFAIWDKMKKELFCARDRFGIKPFYFHNSDSYFCFSSEIKGILKLNNNLRRLNKKGLLDYLSYRYVLGAETLFQDINILLPGHYIITKAGRPVTQKRYYQLPIVDQKKDFGENEVIKKTEELLNKSLELHLRSDVPIGVYLSGGLDSSLLVALMSKLNIKPIKTFSIGFDEEGYSELEFAKIVSQKFNTQHQEFILPGKDYFKLLEKVIISKDSPLLSPNEVAWYVLSEKMKKDVKVVISGCGADELFGGYGRIFRSGYDFERISNLDSYSKEEKKVLISNLNKKYNSLKFPSIVDHFLSQYSYIDYSLKKDLINKDFYSEVGDLLNKENWQADFRKLNKLSPSDQYLYVFQNKHLLGTLLSLDSVTMPASIEGRVPYVDQDLVEYVSSLPLKYKMAWKSEAMKNNAKLLNSDQISDKNDITKYLLKKIAKKYLPSEIFQRQKMGFPVPLDKWFRGKYEDMAKDLLLSKDAYSRDLFNQDTITGLLNHNEKFVKKNHGMHIWMLVNIELWLREYEIAI